MGLAGAECDIDIDRIGAPPKASALSQAANASRGPRSPSSGHALDAYAITAVMWVLVSRTSRVLGAFPPSVVVVPFRTAPLPELNSGLCRPVCRQG